MKYFAHTHALSMHTLNNQINKHNHLFLLQPTRSLSLKLFGQYFEWTTARAKINENEEVKHSRRHKKWAPLWRILLKSFSLNFHMKFSIKLFCQHEIFPSIFNCNFHHVRIWEEFYTNWKRVCLMMRMSKRRVGERKGNKIAYCRWKHLN